MPRCSPRTHDRAEGLRRRARKLHARADTALADRRVHDAQLYRARAQQLEQQAAQLDEVAEAAELESTAGFQDYELEHATQWERENLLA